MSCEQSEEEDDICDILKRMLISVGSTLRVKLDDSNLFV